MAAAVVAALLGGGIDAGTQTSPRPDSGTPVQRRGPSDADLELLRHLDTLEAMELFEAL